MLLRLLLFQVFFLSLPDLYIYRTFVRKVARSTFYKILYWVPTLFFTLGILTLIYGNYNHNLLNEHPNASGIFIIFLFTIGFSKLIYATVSFVGTRCHRIWHWRRKGFRITGSILAACFTLVMLYGWIYGKERFEVKEVTLTSEHIPAAFDGYRIAQLSDFHAGGWENNTEAVEHLVKMTNDLHPDLLVFTGDLVSSHTDELTPFAPILQQLKATHGVYSILGNHDYSDYYIWDNEEDKAEDAQRLIEAQKAMGWKMLNNSHVYLHRGNDSIALIGVENQGDPKFPQHGNLPEAMRGIQSDIYQILLSHNPKHWHQEVVGKTPINLMLAGHTHGMQLSLGNFSPASFVYPEWRGLYTQGKQHLYVNLGCGHIMYPLRIGAWPEITLITLRSAQSR